MSLSDEQDEYMVQYTINRNRFETMYFSGRPGLSYETLYNAATREIMREEGLPVKYKILAIRDGNLNLVE